jgi:Domain of unknown function (DUF4331)
MSSHREAPEISKDPVADSSDLYAFVSPDAPETVTIIANYVPLQLPAGGPNFYEFGDDVLYQIHIDNDNDADSDITYQFQFYTQLSDTGPNDIFLYNTGQINHLTDASWNRKQFYSVTRIDNSGWHVLAENLPCPPCNVGSNSIPSYSTLTTEAIQTVGSSKFFAGQRADGFYVDLGSIFDLGELRPFAPDFLLKGAAVAGINSLANLNVHSIAIQVPIWELTREGSKPTDYMASNSTIGVWTSASRQKSHMYSHPRECTGPWTQVSRLGNPLINEVIIPMGQKDYWNTQWPAGDGQFSQFYDHPSLAGLLNVLYPGAFPNLAAYTANSSNTRPDLDAILLTGLPPLFPGFQNYTGPTKADMLRLNLAITPVSQSSANILGVVGGDNAGFPNGRRVYDDVVSIELKAVAGAKLHDVVPAFSPDAPAAALFDVGGPSSEPTSVASLSAFGLTYPTSFPYLSDPWDGKDNPATQPLGVAG